jgi:methylaspartate mutase sigma subunit
LILRTIIPQFVDTEISGGSMANLALFDIGAAVVDAGFDSATAFASQAQRTHVVARTHHADQPGLCADPSEIGPDSLGPTVILGVAASDAHAVANHLIAFMLRKLRYRVVNLGVCTLISEFIQSGLENPAALAVVIGSVNGHVVEDLGPLRQAKDDGLLPFPVIVGGNLSVGSVKSGNEGQALHDLGVDYVLGDIDELVQLLERLRRTTRSLPKPVVRSTPVLRRHSLLVPVA